MALKSLYVKKQADGKIQEVPGKKQFIFKTTTGGNMVFVENAGEGGLYFKNKAGAYNFLEEADSYERAAKLAQNYLAQQPDVYGKPVNQEGQYYSSPKASRKFAELKDTYLQLLQEGYKPQDVEKFVKEIQTNPHAKSPTPKPGTKPLTKPLTTSIGSLKADIGRYLQMPGVVLQGQNEQFVVFKISNPETLTKVSKGTAWATQEVKTAELYLQDGPLSLVLKKNNGGLQKYLLATEDGSTIVDSSDNTLDSFPAGVEELMHSSTVASQKRASDADNFKGSGINKDCKNPKANEDLDSLKKNDFDRKKCKGSFSTAMEYLKQE